MPTQKQTTYSLRYRQTAADAWTGAIRPYLVQHRPELVDRCCYAVGSSVAYGLADEHSDIDTLLILPEVEIDAHRQEWDAWARNDLSLRSFSAQHAVSLKVRATTWRDIGAAVLFDGQGDWQAYYEGHHHFVSTLILIHDPLGYGPALQRSIGRMPEGLAEAAVARLSGELVSLAADMDALNAAPPFRGLFAYSIVARALPLLFHRARQPLPFHKWQWPLAERLGEEAASVLGQLRHLLERQHVGDAPFPHALLAEGALPVPWRVPPLPVPGALHAFPVDAPLPPELLSQALASVQWHLDERGCYQMVRALARGWRHEGLHYLCATRCLLLKGTALLVTGRLPLGAALPTAWAEVHSAIPELGACLWPEPHQDPVAQALEGIALFRAELRRRGALPALYLDRPLWSPPSYHLACILEEP